MQPKHADFGLYSPHAWGCFFCDHSLFRYAAVFPTCVGVFPTYVFFDCLTTSIPHMRGGVSGIASSLAGLPKYSPHAWGCFPHTKTGQKRRFVFPTCVGVFLTNGPSKILSAKYYPHAWGCFLSPLWIWLPEHVFPTCVGVFLTVTASTFNIVSIPHMRGGVSITDCR